MGPLLGAGENTPTSGRYVSCRAWPGCLATLDPRVPACFLTTNTPRFTAVHMAAGGENIWAGGEDHQGGANDVLFADGEHGGNGDLGDNL